MSSTTDGQNDPSSEWINQQQHVSDASIDVTSRRTRLETDGGSPDRDPAKWTTYTDDEYDYSIDYPVDWSAAPDPEGGATFTAPDPPPVGVVVFVDEGVESVEAYVERFIHEIRADEHIHAFEPATQRDIQLASGHPGHHLDGTYVGNVPTETRQLRCLFSLASGVGYTLEADWNDDAPFKTVATRIFNSFTLDD